MSTQFRAPAPVPTAAPRQFPIVATLAPVLVSVALWLLTSSVFALLFAALGPVVAIAGVADARLGRRRTERREGARLAAELAALETSVALAHDRERAELEERFPTAHALLARGDHDPDRWGSTLGQARLMIGTGEIASGVRVGESEDERVTAIAATAARLTAAPVTVPAVAGVAVVGDGVRATAHARSLVLQLAAQLSPARHELRAHPALAAQWEALPHRVRADPVLEAGVLVFAERESDRDDPMTATIAAVPALGLAPSSARVVVELGDDPVLTRCDDRALCGPIAPEYVSAGFAAGAAQRLAALARRDRVAGDDTLIPDAVTWHDALDPSPAGRDDLACTLGIGSRGPLVVDLVEHGPHAVVGGMTGSGKSELLVSWALALAARHAPAQFSLLLVDFKGGASFAPLEGLPHVAGLISDLDAGAAARALVSLSAEVRHRERVLAGLGARSIAELPEDVDLGRLVVMVDEFATLVTDHPDLHAVFGDLAARGRSLGIHLVLCTQRPSAVVRDGVLANVGIRISLRVNNAADSVAVVGTPAASELGGAPAGRAYVSRGGASAVLAQVPLARETDAPAIAARYANRPRARRSWLDPLPPRLELAALPPSSPGAVSLGRCDDPAAQAQPAAVWRPSDDGPLLVLGAPRSGRTNVLEVIAASGSVARIVDGDPEAAWDAVHADAREPLLIDDLDLVVARMPDDHRSAFLDALALVLREAPAAGRTVALTAQRISAALATVATACPARLMLRMPSRQERVVAGGFGEQHDPDAPPGRAVWRGLEAQVATPSARAPRARTRVASLALDEAPLAVVSPRAAAFAERALSLGLEVQTLGSVEATTAALVVGDPDAWQAAWGSLPARAVASAVLIEGCTASEFRTLLRTRELPPPVIPGRGVALLRRPDGRVERVRLRWPESA